jgi:DNA polymerase-3 subunit beta
VPFIWRAARIGAHHPEPPIAMRVTVEQAALLRALSRATRVAERKNTVPILGNVLVRTTDGGVTFKATDLDMEMTEAIPGEIAAQGAITVPAHVFHDIVRKFPDGAQVSLETTGDKSQMTMRSGRSRFVLQALPESDFPDLAAGEFGARFEIGASDLKRLIDKTQFAISSEETRYYLNGIYMHAIEGEDGPRLRAVATDGHRLARSEIPAPAGAELMPGVIVPRKTVAEFAKFVSDGADKVLIEVSPQKIRLTSGQIRFTSKLIDGTFPDYQRVIPVGNDKTLTIDCAEFTRSVDRVSTISSERGKAVKLSLADGRLTLSVNNPDAGNAVEEIEVEYDAAPLDIGFNARYLLDIAGQLEGDTALFKLADPGSPTLILDREGASTLYVLMPMRV